MKRFFNTLAGLLYGEPVTKRFDHVAAAHSTMLDLDCMISGAIRSKQMDLRTGLALKRKLGNAQNEALRAILSGLPA